MPSGKYLRTEEYKKKMSISKSLKLDEEKIISLYKNGLSCKKIGLMFGVVDMTIAKRLRKNGCHVRTKSENFSGEKNPFFGRGDLLKGEKNPFFGKKHTKKTRKKISAMATGRIISQETRDKISKTNSGKRCGKENPMYGKEGYWKDKHLSDDTKKKISKKLKGDKHPNFNKHLTDEHKLKISLSNIGKKVSKETKKKMSLNMIDRISKNPEEFFKKMSPKFSKGHRRIETILKDNSVNFIHEYKILSYSIDIFLPDYNVCLEIDGEYWHSFPEKKKFDKNRDKKIKELGYKVIRLWHNKEAMKISFEELIKKIEKRKKK